MQKEVVNVALIGYGTGGSVFHAPIIDSVPGLELKKILVNNPERAVAAQKRYPNVEIVGKLKAIIEDDDIGLVVIATPNNAHFSLAKGCLLAGKNVVVDKPFTVTTEEADELIELAKEEGKILSVYQNRRYDSDFLTIKKIVDKNLLGNLVEYEAHFDRFRKEVKDRWKESDVPGSGNLYDLGPHLVDQALCLFGNPKEVTGDIRKQRKGAMIDDYFEIVLGYKNLKVILKAGMLVREPGPHFILNGDRGSFIKYGMDVQEAALGKGLIPAEVEDWGIEPEEIWGILNTEIDGMHFRGKLKSECGDYRIFYANIYNAVVDEEELLVKPEDARDVIKVIELARESSEKKCTLEFY